MTDDELERMLVALPLESPPADLHGRILGATIYRPRLNVGAWEIWVVGTLVACLVWLSVLVFNGTPDVSARIARGLMTAIDSFAAQATSATVLWTALGISAAIWLSQITLPRSFRRPIDS